MRWPWQRRPQQPERIVIYPPVQPSPDAATAKAVESFADSLMAQATRREFVDKHQAAAPDAAAFPSPNITALRIVSDGLGANTRVYLGDEQISGCVGISWSVRGGGIARALIEVDGVQIAHNDDSADMSAAKEA